MFSHREWSRKRYAVNPEYRQRRLASARAYREAHKDEIRERQRRKWQADPAFRKKRLARELKYQRKKWLKFIYGLSLEDYDAMLARQHGACAICKKKSDKTLCVDHCHSTGKVRGLLCHKCNSALAFCNDDPSHFLAAIAYLQASRGEEQATSMTSHACREADQPQENGANGRAMRPPNIVAAGAKPYESGVT